jgi:diguanylate cyclase (GGDEF)-like protein
MTTVPSALPEEVPESQLQEIQASLRKLERRDWWLWVVAIVVMLLLTLAVASLSFPHLLKIEDPFFQFSLNQAVRGLVGLVLLFNTYSIYQQVMIKRARQQLSKQLDAMTRLRARAEEFHKLATIDALTGLYNRRFAEQRLVAETDRSRRYGHPLTVLAIDLNGFKQINDHYGHPAGDLVLKEFAERLNSAIRVSDLAVRLGGDEFLALLPECPPEQVHTLLARLHGLEVNYQGERIAVRFSAGWGGLRARRNARAARQPRRPGALRRQAHTQKRHSGADCALACRPRLDKKLLQRVFLGPGVCPCARGDVSAQIATREAKPPARGLAALRERYSRRRGSKKGR